MITNRSVPCDSILPHLIYRDVVTALEWLTRTFGFTEHYRYGSPGSVDGAQIRLANACVMLRSLRPGDGGLPQGENRKPSLTVFVDDVEAHYHRTKTAGAKITEELNETFYGERQYGVEDLDGHRWLFSQHIRDVSPDEWGATVARH